jgi:hypothetical protein
MFGICEVLSGRRMIAAPVKTCYVSNYFSQTGIQGGLRPSAEKCRKFSPAANAKTQRRRATEPEMETERSIRRPLN